MYTTFTQFPNVSWSSVSGPRSRGFDRDIEEVALKVHEILVSKMQDLGYKDSFVVTTFINEEVRRTRI